MFANKLHEAAHEALKAEQIEKAISLYGEALKETPNHPDILSDRGVAHLHNNDKKNCFQDLNQALELQPEYSYRYACRAYAKNHFGDIDGAVLDYEKAVELDPKDAVAHNNLGMLLEQKGYMQKAKERFERADKLSKMEDQLYDMMDELEGQEQEVTPESPQTEEVVQPREMISPEERREDEISAMKEFKSVFTSKKQFKEFLNFIKNGFKIK